MMTKYEITPEEQADIESRVDGITKRHIRLSIQRFAFQVDRLITGSGIQLLSTDPPWHFENYAADEPNMIHDRGRGAAAHYPTMTFEQMKALPVADVMARHSVCLMWTTNTHIEQSIQLMRAWGFEFKTIVFVWEKMNKNGWGLKMGQGYYTRANCEFVILGKCGKGLKRVDAAVNQLIRAPIREHSRKPDGYFDKVDRLFGTEIKRLEMFARQNRPGWMCIGNEIDGLDIADALREL